MNALDRINQLVAREAKRLEWVASLQPSSPVSLAKIEFNVATELYVDQIVHDRIVLSDGTLYDATTACQEGAPHTARLLIEPNAEDRAAYLARKYRQALNNFPWRDLTNGQLDAVLKFAEDKRQFNIEAQQPQAQAA